MIIKYFLYGLKKIKKSIKFKEKIFDLLLVNEDYFILNLYQKSQIIFIDNNKLKIIKEINGIEYINPDNCLFLFNPYIVINCSDGIVLIAIKTKELIQYLYFEILTIKEIFLGKNEINIIENFFESIYYIKLIFIFHFDNFYYFF